MTRTWVFEQSAFAAHLEAVSFRFLVLAWVVLNAADALVTRWALTTGAGYELNPVYQPLSLLEADLLKAAATGIILLLVYAVRTRSIAVASFLMVSLVAWIGWINLSNLTIVGAL